MTLTSLGLRHVAKDLFDMRTAASPRCKLTLWTFHFSTHTPQGIMQARGHLIQDSSILFQTIRPLSPKKLIGGG